MISFEGGDSSRKKLFTRIKEMKPAWSKGKFDAKKDLYPLMDGVDLLLAKEPLVLDLAVTGSIIVAGDIHGQLADLIRIFHKNNLPPAETYLFLGDYVDRGEYGLEVLMLLLALKMLYPNNVFLLRGNHEEAEQNESYGFKDECRAKYSEDLWLRILKTFSWLPVAAIVNKKVLSLFAFQDFRIVLK